MTQQYRIKVTNGTASYYFEKGKVYPNQMLAFSAAGVVYYSYKWLYGDNHGIKTVVEEYRPHVTDIFVETCLSDCKPVEIDTF